MTISPSFIGPRELSTVSVIVTPTKGDAIIDSWLQLTVDDERDSVAIPFSGDAPQQASLDITAPNAPVSADLRFAARTRARSGASDSTTGVLTIGDTTPPSVWWTDVDDTVESGRTVYIAASYYDKSGLARYELHTTGALIRDDVSNESSFPTDGSIAFAIVVPAEPGDSIVQMAVGTDMYGLRSSIRQVYHIASP
ncbi:MAG TPA: hypothetical protein VFW89_06500 [Gemmatimonadaceae bacterium]|nr:hypothetical protein [Gemmatimonadaceae bacterium]